MNTPLSELVKDVLNMILEDGLGECRTFSELHDHIDANEYPILAIEHAADEDRTVPTEGAAWLTLCNEITDAVNEMLPLYEVEINTNIGIGGR